jgi:multidrug efflux pump subunit AcrA (membrane-fusion protein)
MGLLTRNKTPEEIARDKEISEQKRLEGEARKQADEARKQAELAKKQQLAFAASTQGKARAAYERGDVIFQYSIDVMTQSAVVHTMASLAPTGATTRTKKTDAVGVLNAVASEGWELVNGSFVFVEQGQQSRDKFMSSGQQVATKGVTMGYYLFRRNPSAKVTDND